MCEIKKILFSVSEKGNPMAQIWVDDADITKSSDSIYIAIKSQVAYLFFLGEGSKISLKKSNKFYNVEVPETFTNLFENYKISTDNNIKMIGSMMNRAFDNAFNSIEFIKNGETVKISQEEANAKCLEYLNGYTNLYDTVLDFLNNSKNKTLKSVGKILTTDGSKASDIKEANSIAMTYTSLLAREVIAKNNFVIDTDTVG